MATTAVRTKRVAMRERGRNPPAALPGRREEGGVGRPKRYLTGPALVISQERLRERPVLTTRTTGRDPEMELFKDTHTDWDSFLHSMSGFDLKNC